MPKEALSCLLEKISLYLKEYLGDKIQEELDMAFKSIGQKYGFVSAGDVYRKRLADGIAEARVEEQAKAQKLVAEKVAEVRQKADERIAEERQKAEKSEAEKLNAVKKMVCDGVISVENAMAYFGIPRNRFWRSDARP